MTNDRAAQTCELGDLQRAAKQASISSLMADCGQVLATTYHMTAHLLYMPAFYDTFNDFCRV